MEALLLYLIELCKKQSQALVLAQAIIEEQEDFNNSLLFEFDSGLDLLDREFKEMELILK